MNIAKVWRKTASAGSPRLHIRLLRRGCVNRLFYHIIVAPYEVLCHKDGLEQIGTYDPMPNERNEKLLSVNVERLQYWLAQGAHVQSRTAILLGLAGVLPIHPQTYVFAWLNRRDKMAEEKKNEAEKAEA